MAGRNRAVLMALVTAVALTASGGGHQSGIFQGYVNDATEEWIANKIGKPDRIGTSDPNAPR